MFFENLLPIFFLLGALCFTYCHCCNEGIHFKVKKDKELYHSLLPVDKLEVTVEDNIIRCVRRCLRTDKCLSTHYHEENKTCDLLQYNENDIFTTLKHSAGLLYVALDSGFLQQPCAYNGSRLSVPKCGAAGVTICDCPLGTYGSYCQNIVQDCFTGLHEGNVQPPNTMNHWVRILAQPALTVAPFSVLCYTPFPFTVIQYREMAPGAAPFNRTWEDYKHGFGSMAEDGYFLGLEKLYTLTKGSNRCCNMKFRLMITFPWEEKHILYENVYIDGEDNNYTFHTTGPHPFYLPHTLPDSMSVLDGAPFSTEDRINSPCMSTESGGWWFKGLCTEKKSNLNGYMDGKTFDPPFAYWNGTIDLNFTATSIAIFECHNGCF